MRFLTNNTAFFFLSVTDLRKKRCLCLFWGTVIGLWLCSTKLDYYCRLIEITRHVLHSLDHAEVNVGRPTLPTSPHFRQKSDSLALLIFDLDSPPPPPPPRR